MTCGRYRRHGKKYVRCHYCKEFEAADKDLENWAKVELEGQTIYFHDRELGDCYDCWLLSPMTEREKK